MKPLMARSPLARERGGAAAVLAPTMRRLVPFFAAVFLSSGAAFAAESFPAKPVRIVVPFAAGGSTDIIARQLGQLLSAAWSQPVFVENRGGAGGILGSDVVARAAPDGYTLLMGSVSTHAIIPHINPKMPYDPIADFSPITEIARFASMLVVNPNLPVKSVKELIALAMKRPGELTYASNGNGTNSHLAGEVLRLSTRIDLLHVPYKGAAPATADVIAGHVAMMFTGVANGIPHVRSGRLRPLAIAAMERSPSLPDVPTFEELGVRNMDMTIWLGLWGPGGMPSERVQRLNADAVAALKSTPMRELFGKQDAVGVGSTPAAFSARVRDELARWGRIVRTANVKPD
jgi:tripartite-type tricarboxylate transporter receptor subunit TctC